MKYRQGRNHGGRRNGSGRNAFFDEPTIRVMLTLPEWIAENLPDERKERAHFVARVLKRALNAKGIKK